MMSYSDTIAVMTVIVDTVREAGKQGAPSGALYLAWSERGGTLESYQKCMSVIESTGLVRCVNHVYYYCAAD